MRKPCQEPSKTNLYAGGLTLVSQLMSTSRLEAFSDGVIAVIITIMVLELKVPALHVPDREVLQENLKILGVYLLSFVQVGIYWVNHHYLLDDLKTITHGILWANLGLLFTLSLVPFGVEWIGTRGVNPLPVAVYAVCFSLPAIAWGILALVISRRTRIKPAAGLSKQLFSAALNVGAIFVAFFSPRLAFAMIAVVAIIWLVPPRRVVEKTRELGSPNTASHSS